MPVKNIILKKMKLLFKC